MYEDLQRVDSNTHGRSRDEEARRAKVGKFSRVIVLAVVAAVAVFVLVDVNFYYEAMRQTW